MIDELLRSFVEFMDSRSLSDSAWLLAATPVLCVVVAVHELGHAAFGLACTEGIVRVHVGRAPGVVEGRLGRLLFSIDVRPARQGDAGWAALADPLTRREFIAYALAGPGANLLFALMLVPSFAELSGTLRLVVGMTIVLSLATALWNLVPTTGSDGREALEALRTASAEPSAKPGPREA